MSEQATTNQPAQGWYADPNDAGQLRWWDGSTWSDHVHPMNGAADSAPASAPAVVSNPAPKAKASGPSGDRSAVAEWLSVRSNQMLLAVLIVAFALFAFVMLGGGT